MELLNNVVVLFFALLVSLYFISYIVGEKTILLLILTPLHEAGHLVASLLLLCRVEEVDFFSHIRLKKGAPAWKLAIVSLAGPIASMLPAYLAGMPLTWEAMPILNWVWQSPVLHFIFLASFMASGILNLIPITKTVGNQRLLSDGANVIVSIAFAIFGGK